MMIGPSQPVSFRIIRGFEPLYRAVTRGGEIKVDNNQIPVNKIYIALSCGPISWHELPFY